MAAINEKFVIALYFMICCCQHLDFLDLGPRINFASNGVEYGYHWGYNFDSLVTIISYGAFGGF